MEVPKTDEHIQENVLNLKAAEHKRSVSGMHENVFNASNTD